MSDALPRESDDLAAAAYVIARQIQKNADYQEPDASDVLWLAEAVEKLALAIKQRLTWDQVLEIRARAADDHTIVYHELAVEYGVSRGHIQDIIQGRRYKHRIGEYVKPDRPCKLCGRSVPQERKRNAKFCCDEHRVQYWAVTKNRKTA